MLEAVPLRAAPDYCLTFGFPQIWERNRQERRRMDMNADARVLEVAILLGGMRTELERRIVGRAFSDYQDPRRKAV
jgi:hypothetical protein